MKVLKTLADEAFEPEKKTKKATPKKKAEPKPTATKVKTFKVKTKKTKEPTADEQMDSVIRDIEKILGTIIRYRDKWCENFVKKMNAPSKKKAKK